MGRRKGSKNLNGEEPWKKYGLTRDAYYSRFTKGIPLEQPSRKGRKTRFSGLSYENSEERFNEIKEKYKNGVTDEIVFEFVNKFFPKEC